MYSKTSALDKNLSSQRNFTISNVGLYNVMVQKGWSPHSGDRWE